MPMSAGTTAASTCDRDGGPFVRGRGARKKSPAGPVELANQLKLPCRNIWEALGRVSQDDRESAPEAEKATSTPGPWGTPLGRLMKKYGPAAAVVLAVFVNRR